MPGRPRWARSSSIACRLTPDTSRSDHAASVMRAMRSTHHGCSAPRSRVPAISNNARGGDDQRDPVQHTDVMVREQARFVPALAAGCSAGVPARAHDFERLQHVACDPPPRSGATSAERAAGAGGEHSAHGSECPRRRRPDQGDDSRGYARPPTAVDQASTGVSLEAECIHLRDGDDAVLLRRKRTCAAVIDHPPSLASAYDTRTSRTRGRTAPFLPRVLPRVRASRGATPGTSRWRR